MRGEGTTRGSNQSQTAIADPAPPSCFNRRRQSGGGVLGEAALRRAQPLDRPLDLAALALQVADLGDDLLRIELILEIRRFARPLAADQILDFGEGEAKLLALEDHL